MAQMKVCFDDVKSEIKDEMIELGERFEIDLGIDSRHEDEECNIYETDMFRIYIRFAKESQLLNSDGYEYMEFYDYYDETDNGCLYEMEFKMVEDHCEVYIPSIIIKRIRNNDTFYFSRFSDTNQIERSKQLMDKWKMDNLELEKSIKEECRKKLENQKLEIERQLREL